MSGVKILWISNSPRVGSGYGQQTRLFVPRIASLGHEVAIFAFHGAPGGMSEWEGHPVYPAGQLPYGGDVAGLHARHFGADLVITLMDQWALSQDTLQGLNVACWMPVDCDPLSVLDMDKLDNSRPARIPIAMSRFGEGRLKAAGYNPLYVPHGIDTGLFRPPDDRETLREAMGVSDRFVVLMVAANLDKQRKAWPEQMAAFAKLRDRHPEALLVCHTLEHTGGGLNLRAVAERVGAAPDVKFSAQYLMTSGTIEPEMMRGTFGMADLYSGCSKAEGFGLPVLEALSCGVPAVVTQGSAMTEVGGPAAWKVKGTPLWASGHESWWVNPGITDIARAYERAYDRNGPYQAKKKAAREHALAYDADRVLTEYWEPALKQVEARMS